MRDPPGLSGLMRGRRLGRVARDGYDKKSLVGLGLLVLVASGVGYRWSDLVDASGVLDQLLLGIWVWMAAAITWNVSPRRDALLIAVGAAGGGIIEWWGTNARLWAYFTGERPPLWILPAWPAAALTIDRMGAMLHRCLGVEKPSAHLGRIRRWFMLAYFALLLPFVVCMTLFIGPTLHSAASKLVVGWMLLVALYSPEPRRDVELFVAGSLLGALLEYWGTSRECWTYYTRQIPPPVAVFAHGFASVAFARMSLACGLLLGWLARKTGSSWARTA
jgi:hypothetical protein